MRSDKASLSAHIVALFWSPARAFAFLKSQTQRAFVMPALNLPFSSLYSILKKNLRMVYEEYHTREYDEHWNSISQNTIGIIDRYMWSPKCSSWEADNFYTFCHYVWWV